MRSILSKIATIIKSICAIFLVLLIIVLAMQRFSNNQIAIGGFRVFNVATTSMVPKYVVGDIVVTKYIDPENLQVGDDITYLGKVESYADRVVTHRLIEIEETEEGKIYHTKGIANPDEDPTIKADQIYGKVVYKSFILSYIAKLMNNMTAFYIIVLIPLSVLVVMQIIDIAQRRSEDEDDEEDDDDEDDEDDEDEDDEEDDE